MASTLDVFALTSSIALAVLTFCLAIGARFHVSPIVVRKLMHCATGCIFILCLIAFPHAAYTARLESGALREALLAAIIPLIPGLYFYCVGRGLISHRALVKAVSRSGEAMELTRGPAVYGIVISAVTALYFTHSPVTVIVIATLCLGDGTAELFGRHFTHSPRIPWNERKSVAGSAGMLVSSLVGCAVLSVPFLHYGCWRDDIGFGDLMHGSLVAVLASTLVESLPIRDWDNVTTTLAAALTAHAYFR